MGLTTFAIDKSSVLDCLLGLEAEFKEWLLSLDTRKVFSLVDWSLSMSHLVKGEKIIEAIKEVVPDVQIEDMALPFSAIATDLYTGEEVVFSSGKLFDAIRASISIPSLFRPVPYGMSMLIDGCMVNCLPLNRVVRSEDDILVAFDTNYMNPATIRTSLLRESVEAAAEEAFYQQTREQAASIVTDFKSQTTVSMVDRLRNAGSQAIELLDRIREFRQVAEERTDNDFGDTYMSIIDRSFSIMNHHQTVRMVESITPDLLVRMPFDAYGDIADYAKASEISQLGRQLMAQALDKYEL